jgi:hypothetical protein
MGSIPVTANEIETAGPEGASWARASAVIARKRQARRERAVLEVMGSRGLLEVREQTGRRVRRRYAAGAREAKRLSEREVSRAVVQFSPK